MSNLKNLLTDIIRLSATYLIDVFKLETNDTETIIMAHSKKTSIVLNSEAKDYYVDIKGIIGINQPQFMNALLKMKIFQGDDTKIDVKKRDRNGDIVPEEILFTNDTASASYRFMHHKSIAPMPWFNGAHKWNLEFSVTSDIVTILQQLTNLLSDEQSLTLKIDGDVLVANIGDEYGASHRGSANLINGMSGINLKTLKWPVQEMMHVLRLCDKNSIIRMNDKVMNVEIETDIAIHNFYIQPII